MESTWEFDTDKFGTKQFYLKAEVDKTVIQLEEVLLHHLEQGKLDADKLRKEFKEFF